MKEILTDKKIWQPKFEKNKKEINELKSRLTNSEVDVAYQGSNILATSDAGPWERKYYASKDEFIWLLEKLKRKEENSKKIFSSEEEVQKQKAQVVAAKNILLIGRVGSGKSTLANILFDENSKVFAESKYGIGETRVIQSNEAVINGVKYNIIDTVGIGKTRLSEEEIAQEMFKMCQKLNGGLLQILFVISKRITLEEIKVYDIIREKIFDNNEEDIAKYTTIIRTNFNKFQTPEECNKDFELLKNENRKVAKLIELINPGQERKKVIYVDSPPLEPDYYDQEEITNHKKKRKESRKTLINHLKGCQSSYKLENLEVVDKIFRKYMVDNGYSKKPLNEILRKKREEIKNKSFSTKLNHKLSKLLGEKSKTEQEQEMENSLLKAVIEINDICKQM